jgi:hypothetical protein
MAWTFAAVCVAWVFFRADSIGAAWEYLCGMIRPSTPDTPTSHVSKTAFAFMAALVAVDFVLLQMHADHVLLSRRMRPLRWFVYTVGSWLVWKHFSSLGTFIYFQF